MTDVKKLMEKTRSIRILTNRLVDERLSGAYHSMFKGTGVEFDEVRPYIPGDDVRSIDWNVTARTGAPYIKRYSEERELTVIFAVDVSGSQIYGSRTRSKAELAAEIASLLALTAIRNQDKIGLILFSDRIVKYLPPRKGRQSVMRLVREVLAAEDETSGGTDIAGALEFLNNVRKRKAVVFLVSDFFDSGYEERLAVTARRHDVVAVKIYDPAERLLPGSGLVELQDPETGELVLADVSNASVRRAFEENAAAEDEALRSLFRRHAIDFIEVSTDGEYVRSICALFARRAARRNGGRR